MKIIVTGGRDFADCDFVFRVLDRLHDDHGIGLLVHGGATGVDSMAADWAADNAVQRACFDVTDSMWNRHGKAAGPWRNAAMLVVPVDCVLAFPGGRGTQNMVSQARSQRVSILFAEEVCPRND